MSYIKELSQEPQRLKMATIKLNLCIYSFLGRIQNLFNHVKNIYFKKSPLKLVRQTEMTHVANIIPGSLDTLCGVPGSGRCSLLTLMKRSISVSSLG